MPRSTSSPPSRELDPALRARAGVLTGEAAVTLGAEGQGMVAGDLVNTASRVQSEAEPGTVLVGEATKRATEAAIAYEDAGTHDLKGKAEPMQLFRALRVIAGRAGALRSSSLEPPFVGRERELRLVKELFHATADERRAQLVSVVGVAGVGKSRISWEFEKYQDGLAEEAWWHRGRCLSYGEGVAYWALAEMVRMRCGITEDEEVGSALAKLRATLEEHVTDPEERGWVEPRLAHLLGLEEGVAGDQENLFSAWRVLFERLAEVDPVVLVFEDMQWADAGLLDFLDYLLDWSRNHPIFVLSLARPELAEKHPSWGAGKRAVTSLYLEPLPRPAMESCSPASSRACRRSCAPDPRAAPRVSRSTPSRRCGCCSTAACSSHDGTAFRPTGPIETLEVPETLHALVAARLDGLDRRGAAARPGRRRARQDVHASRASPRSPGSPTTSSSRCSPSLRPQGGALDPGRSALARARPVRVPPGHRQARRLRDALEARAQGQAPRGGAVPGDASGARRRTRSSRSSPRTTSTRATRRPEAEDADEIKGTAREMLVRAAERASSLGATAEAQRAYERAIELTDDAVVQAELHERAGIEASAGARAEDAIRHFEDAIERLRGRRRRASGGAGLRPACRDHVGAGEARGRGREPGALVRGALARTSRTRRSPRSLRSSDASRSSPASSRSRAERIETALDLAEALLLPEVLSQALNTKAVMLASRGRPPRRRPSSSATRSRSLSRQDKPSAALRAYNNVADMLVQADRYEEADQMLAEGIAYARRVGNRQWERSAALVRSTPPSPSASGTRCSSTSAGADRPAARRIARLGLLSAMIGSRRPHPRPSRERSRRPRSFVDSARDLESSADAQERAAYASGKSLLLLATGNPAEALALAEQGSPSRHLSGSARST